jgi:hypothetical protein
VNANMGTSRSPSRRGEGFLIVFAAFVLVLAAACNPGAGPSTAPMATPLFATGVHGLVLAGPTCPVERAGQSPCVRSVSGATILALDSAGHEVGRAVSDAAGVYFLRLPPGTYKIVPQVVRGFMGAPAATPVTVSDGAPSQLDLRYDTGIR